MAERKIKSISFKSNNGDTLVFKGGNYEQLPDTNTPKIPARIDLKFNVNPNGQDASVQPLLKGIDMATFNGYWFVLSRKYGSRWKRFSHTDAKHTETQNQIINNDLRPNPLPLAEFDPLESFFQVDSKWAIQYFIFSGLPWIDSHPLRKCKRARNYINGQNKGIRMHYGRDKDVMIARTVRFNIKARVELVEGNGTKEHPFGGKDALLISPEFTIRMAYSNSEWFNPATPQLYIQII